MKGFWTGTASKRICSQNCASWLPLFRRRRHPRSAQTVPRQPQRPQAWTPCQTDHDSIQSPSKALCTPAPQSREDSKQETTTRPKPPCNHLERCKGSQLYPWGCTPNYWNSFERAVLRTEGHQKAVLGCTRVPLLGPAKGSFGWGVF